MIKTYCDRCEEEIKVKQKTALAELAETIASVFGGDTKKDYMICVCNGKNTMELTLCENCRDNLRTFMTKTQIHRNEVMKIEDSNRS